MNHITAIGLQHLRPVLEDNSSITKLYLSQTFIGDEGAKVLAEVLKTNSTLESLYLQHCGIGNEGLVAILEAIRYNTTIDVIRFTPSKATAKLCKAIQDELLKPKTLRHETRAKALDGSKMRSRRVVKIKKRRKPLASKHQVALCDINVDDAENKENMGNGQSNLQAKLKRRDMEIKRLKQGIKGLDITLYEQIKKYEQREEEFDAYLEENEKLWQESQEKSEKMKKSYKCLELEVVGLRDKNKELFHDCNNMKAQIRIIMAEHLAEKQGLVEEKNELRSALTAAKVDFVKLKKASQDKLKQVQEDAKNSSFCDVNKLTLDTIKEAQKRVEQYLSELNDKKVDLMIRDRESKKVSCCICMDNSIKSVFRPCGHFCACNGCMEKLDKCPLCNTAKQDIQPVFFSN